MSCAPMGQNGHHNGHQSFYSASSRRQFLDGVNYSVSLSDSLDQTPLGALSSLSKPGVQVAARNEIGVVALK